MSFALTWLEADLVPHEPHSPVKAAPSYDPVDIQDITLGASDQLHQRTTGIALVNYIKGVSQALQRHFKRRAAQPRDMSVYCELFLDKTASYAVKATPALSEGDLQDLKRNLAGVAVPQITGQAVTLKIRIRVGAPPAP